MDGAEPVRVMFEMPATGIGFFPGLAKPVLIEADRLGEADAQALTALITAARIFEKPVQEAAPAPRTADARQYAITVEQGGQRRTIQVAEPIDDPDLRRLVHFLEAKVADLRATDRTGSRP
jgi:hypothetical protein